MKEISSLQFTHVNIGTSYTSCVWFNISRYICCLAIKMSAHQCNSDVCLFDACVILIDLMSMT